MPKALDQLNFVNQCHRANLTLWQCPSFLVVLTGLITISAIIATYLIAARYSTEPEIAALIAIGVAVILIIINYSIIQGFEQLARANQLKTEFVSIASHQLRAPLSSIKWLLNLITQKPSQLTSEQLESLGAIEKSNQEMVDLVNDLLDVSRIEQGRLKTSPQKINLKEITEAAIKEYSPLAKASNVKILLEDHKNLSLAWADPQYIKLVFENLIDNAIKYIKANHQPSQIIIRLKNKNGSVRCEIKDNGVGIPEEEHSQIFQKFFRSKNIMKYQTKGTGLGLFIAKAIIKNSKGKIGFQSQEDKGSTFWFELPVK